MKKAIKHDSNKPRTDLLPVIPLLKTSEVFGYGANEYDDYNYCKGDGLKWSRMYGACLRHLFAWFNKEDFDESGFHHLYHALCELLMLCHNIELGHKVQDDRPA